MVISKSRRATTEALVRLLSVTDIPATVRDYQGVDSTGSAAGVDRAVLGINWCGFLGSQPNRWFSAKWRQRYRKAGKKTGEPRS